MDWIGISMQLLAVVIILWLGSLLYRLAKNVPDAYERQFRVFDGKVKKPEPGSSGKVPPLRREWEKTPIPPKLLGWEWYYARHHNFTDDEYRFSEHGVGPAKELDETQTHFHYRAKPDA